MLKKFLAIVFVLCLALVFSACQKNENQINNIDLKINLPNVMKISSPAFENNADIPAKYTCDADDINPELKIAEVPENAASLALIVDDPDAPAGDWVHWLVWNIPVEAAQISENSVPVGAVLGKTDFGKQAWGGPCPGSGKHHYQFKLYALDTNLDLPAVSSKPELLKAIDGHILDQASLVGLYERQ